MQPGALRALEFDRIVEAVKAFALTPMGAERLARLQPSTDPRQVAQLLAGNQRDGALPGGARLVSAPRVERAAADFRRARRRGTRARSAPAAGARRVPRFDRRVARRHPPRAGIVSAARGGQRRRGLVQGRDGADARKDRSVRRGGRSRESRAEGSFAIGCANNDRACAARSNRIFAATSSTFTPSQITAGANNPIIAAFWADVDTRGGAGTSTGGNATGSNRVYYDLDATNGVLTVTWDDVGYYNSHKDKLDAFHSS